MSHIAERLSRISVSQSIAMAEEARRLRGEGKSVINLAIGEPDFDTPKHVQLAAIKAILDGKTRYTDVSGTVELRNAIVESVRKNLNVEYGLNEVIVSTGGKQVIYNAMVASLNPGDEVLIPTPCWVSYPDIVSLAEGIPVFLPCGEESGFKLTPDQLENAITPKTRWLILNNPCNPTGAAYSEDEIKGLCDVLLKHPDVWVLTDDIYDRIVFSNFKVSTFVKAEPSLKSRVLTVNGCSKTYAMTGWRLGYATGPAELIRAMVKLQGQSTTNPSSISQAAAVEALTGSQAFLDDMVASYESRRDYLVRRLNEIDGMSCATPQGAFYVFPNIKRLFGKKTKAGSSIESDLDFSLALLKEKYVAAVHGSAYIFPGYVRIGYALDQDSISEAVDRIADFCAEMS